MTLNKKQFAKAEMLIRKPIDLVFQAFIDPKITTKFWFTKSSGKLKEGEKTEWTWEMYNHSTSILTKKIELNKKILIEWTNNTDLTTVEWNFKSLDENLTFVSIINYGFEEKNDKTIEAVRSSTEGFTLVLAGLKAYLEHNIELNLVADRFPKGIE